MPKALLDDKKLCNFAVYTHLRLFSMGKEKRSAFLLMWKNRQLFDMGKRE